MSKTSTQLCYPVLMPFKFRGVIAKPPAFVQLAADQARQYQDAGVLGGEDVACLPPDGGDSHPSESGKDESSDRATDGALDPAASQTAPAGVSGDGAKAPAKTRAPAKAAAPRKKAAK
ncbi:MAG: hypothetical protein WDA70_03660 [Lysobacteraceae bacterium]